MKYAIGLYSVRDELAKDLWGTLRKIKAMGYDGVEFFGGFRHTAQEMKAALDDTGLVCVGWHTSWDSLSEGSLMAVITYNKVLGNKELVVPWIPDEMTNSKKALLATAKAFEEMAERLAHYGMKLAYHNHNSEFRDVEGDMPIHYLYDNTCLLGMQLDNGNALSAGPDTDIYGLLLRYPNRVRTIHHKPFSLKDGFSTMFGEDSIDWGKFFKLCREHQKNLEWHVVEYEDEKYSQMEGIELSIKALRKMEAEGKI
jgi:sugar phosphate isomerase/epimerase